MFRPLAKWPVLMAAAMCIAIGAILIREVPNGNIVTGLTLISLGALLLGAFLTLYILELFLDAKEPRPRPHEGDRDGAQ